LAFASSLSRRLGAAAFGAILAAGSAQAQYQGDRTGQTLQKENKTLDRLDTKQTSLNAYESALKFKQAGDYARAIALLEPQARQGHGFELAQLVLGQCYLASADKAPTPEAAAEASKKGGSWIRTAAEAGLPAAQEQMARLEFEGVRVDREPVEAGKWYLLWKANPARFQGVSTPFDPALVQKLQATLTDAQWATAQKAADAARIAGER